MKYAFYPGCSLEVNAAAYDISVRAVAKVLEIELEEVEDWNCCGATEYFSQDELTACSVIARNLAIAGQQECKQLTAPCAACFLNLKKVDHLMAEHPELGAKVNQALAAGGLSYTPGTVQVRHLLDVMYTDVGEDVIRGWATKPLKGLTVAPYYGCQVVRPFPGDDDPEQPKQLDQLIEWLGAKVPEYPVKGHCCGGHMTQISEPEAFEMIRRLLDCAEQRGADVIACLCPMCQLNLDAYQSKVNAHFGTNYRLPILYFTQLMGLAFGLAPSELGFGKEIVAAEPVIVAKTAVA